MEIDRDKYIVFKRDSLTAVNLAVIERYALDDAVVIRKQDVFAEAGLRAYASSILTCVEIIQQLPADGTEQALQDLMELADFIHGEADDAHRRAHHLPD